MSAWQDVSLAVQAQRCSRDSPRTRQVVPRPLRWAQPRDTAGPGRRVGPGVPGGCWRHGVPQGTEGSPTALPCPLLSLWGAC